MHLPPGEAIPWLIPATGDERTAVAPLIFACGGATARPWLRPGTPEHGSFRIIGSEDWTSCAAGKGCLVVLDFTNPLLPALCTNPLLAAFLG